MDAKSAPAASAECPAFALRYGHARTPLVQAVPDAVYPEMWRLLWPDGQLSDLANLSRIKDAAIAICERGPPARNRLRLHWEINRSNSPRGAAPVRQMRRPLLQSLPGVGAAAAGGVAL